MLIADTITPTPNPSFLALFYVELPHEMCQK